MKKRIQFFNRYKRCLEEEPICGERFLRFAHGTFCGRLLQYFVGSRLFLSRLAARYANSRRSAKKIVPFVRRYAIDTSESLLPLEHFETFNEFFFRQLRPEVRPIDGDRDSIVAPADGRYFFIPDLSRSEKIEVKGRRLHLETLLGDKNLAKKFHRGCGFIVRLCPMDYHRFHFPCDGIPGKSRLINGRLHSVNPLALARRLVLCENRRHLTRIISSQGEIAMVEVGATFVGAIGQTYVPHRHAKKGMEKGFFAFGGSSIVLLFEPRAIHPETDILKNSETGLETYVRFGDHIGRSAKNTGAR